MDSKTSSVSRGTSPSRDEGDSTMRKMGLMGAPRCLEGVGGSLLGHKYTLKECNRQSPLHHIALGGGGLASTIQHIIQAVQHTRVSQERKEA